MDRKFSERLMKERELATFLAKRTIGLRGLFGSPAAPYMIIDNLVGAYLGRSEHAEALAKEILSNPDYFENVVCRDIDGRYLPEISKRIRPAYLSVEPRLSNGADLDMRLWSGMPKIREEQCHVDWSENTELALIQAFTPNMSSNEKAILESMGLERVFSKKDYRERSQKRVELYQFK